MSDLSALPPVLQDLLRKHVSRGRNIALARHIALILVVLFAWAAFWCVIDRFHALNGWVRFSALAGAAITAAIVLSAALRRRLLPQLEWVSVAQEIESQNPQFGQRLTTVISRLLGKAQYRGSDEILEHLVYHVGRDVAGQRMAPSPPAVRALPPWLGVLACLLLTGALFFIPNLGLPRLAARFVAPFGDLPPVTTTQIIVHPGDCDLPQSAPLQIEVDAERLDHSPVWINWSDDGQTWARSQMSARGNNPGDGGQYVFTVGSIERDLRYFVTGGDATSPPYNVRVLRRPAVSEFKVRYTYPLYTGKPSITVTNADGLIEAPAGTEAELTLTATEPLQLALLTPPGGEKMLLAKVDADNVRRGKFLVQHDGRYALDLVSTREQPGSGPVLPGSMRVHVLLDQPPVVRLAEAGALFRLRPGDTLPLSCDVRDDYGIDSVILRAQTGNGPAVDALIYPASNNNSGDVQAGRTPPGAAPHPMPRHIETRFYFDLATVPLSIGDVLTLTLTARDSQGQPTFAAPIQVLVAPHSIAPSDGERVAELIDASELADNITIELTAALRAIDQPGQEPAAEQNSRRDRDVAAAGDSAALLRRTLLRIEAHGPPPALGRALTAWIDNAEQAYGSARAAMRIGAADNSAPAFTGVALARELIVTGMELGRQLRTDLDCVSQGERSAALLADLDNLATAGKRPPPADARVGDRLRQTLDRVRADIDLAAHQLGLSTTAVDLEAQLRVRIARATEVIASRSTVDFASAAREWADLDIKQDVRAAQLEQRLGAAAEAEAVRSGSDLIWSRDLQLAAAAAAALRESTGAMQRATLNAFADAVATLEQAARQKSQPTAAASAAREQLLQWAGERLARDDSTTLPATTPGHPGGTPARDGRQISTDASQGIASVPATAVPGGHPAPPPSPETLALNAAAVSAEHQYAQTAALDDLFFQSLQLQLTRTLPATADLSPPDREVQLWQLGRLQEQRRLVGQELAAARQIDSLSDRLHTLNVQTRQPDKAAAPVLADRQRELVDQIPAPTRTAVSIDSSWSDESKLDISSAEETHFDRDPLIAAKRSAQAAAEALGRSPPDFELAAHHQDLSASALTRAWDLSIHRAAQLRLAEVPSLRSLYSTEPITEAGLRLAIGTLGNATDPAARDWRHLAPRQPDNTPAAGRPADPAGYESALKAYFDALGQQPAQ